MPSVWDPLTILWAPPSVLPTAWLQSLGMFHPTAAVLGDCPTEIIAGWRSFFAMEADRCLLYHLAHLSIFSVRAQASHVGSVSQFLSSIRGQGSTWCCEYVTWHSMFSSEDGIMAPANLQTVFYTEILFPACVV